MKHKQDRPLAVLTAVVLITAGTLGFSNVYADAGDVDGDAVISEREQEEAVGEEEEEVTEDGEEVIGEEEEVTEEEAGDITGEGEEVDGEEEDEVEDTDEKPWYKKYWWALLCPAVLVFFGLGVGVYYLVSWIKERRA